MTVMIKSFWNERWEPVETPSPTANFDYYISDYGRIKSINKKNQTEKLLSGSSLKSGLKQLNLRLKGKKRHSLYIHKFIADKFIKKDSPDQKFVIHLDRNYSNNYFKNLKWMSQNELVKWQIENGVYNPKNKKRGSNTKLNESAIRLIKKRIAEGKTKKKIIAKSFGISTMQLNRIERGENWGYVTIENDK